MTETIDGRRDIDGIPHWIDGKGSFVPESVVKSQDKLKDEVIRKIVGYAAPLSAEVARFREHCFDDVDALVALLEQEYGVKRGGKKGNLSLVSYDGTLKVQVAVAESIHFGPELQMAKDLVDECLADWVQGSRDELRAFITRAFQVDSQNKINRGNLLYLLRLDIKDERWQQAMRAIKDSMQPAGSKRYVRIYQRKDAEAPWQPISIDMAAA